MPTANALLDKDLVLESFDTIERVVDYCNDHILDDDPVKDLINNGSISHFFNGKTCLDVANELGDRAIKQLTGNPLSDYKD